MPITQEQQYYYNQTSCNCQGRAIVEENLVTPNFINAVGGLFVSTNNPTGQPLSANDSQFLAEKKSKTGLIVVSIVGLAIVIGVIMLLKKKKK